MKAIKGFVVLGLFLNLAACSNAEFCATCAYVPTGAELANSLPGNIEYIKSPDPRLPAGAEEGFILIETLFESGSDRLTPEFEAVLQEFGLYLLRKNPLKATINGHTDSVGSEASNLDLSQRRAKTVSDFLVNGSYISSSKVESAGYGESTPIDTNDTAEGRARNRRVEIFLDLQ